MHICVLCMQCFALYILTIHEYVRTYTCVLTCMHTYMLKYIGLSKSVTLQRRLIRGCPQLGPNTVKPRTKLMAFKRLRKKDRDAENSSSSRHVSPYFQDSEKQFLRWRLILKVNLRKVIIELIAYVNENLQCSHCHTIAASERPVNYLSYQIQTTPVLFWGQFLCKVRIS